MSAPLIYNFFQRLFPELEQQHIPADSPEHFGQFFDWLNLNATYLQALDLISYQHHGFEDNHIFEQAKVPYLELNQLLNDKIQQLTQQTSYYSQHMLHQEKLRLIICTISNFLIAYQLDVLVIVLHKQKYWLSFPQIDETCRTQLIHLLKSEFSTVLPIQILDPKKMALFY